MRIAVDAMGGDNAPHEVVAGAVQSCAEEGHEVVLVGQPAPLKECLAIHGDAGGRVHICPAEETVGMGEKPAAVLKRKKTSLSVGVKLLADGEAHGVVSAGNSGAFMAYAWRGLGMIDGVERPAIAISFPTPKGSCVLLDAGANATCQPEHLVQFAHMGSVYASDVLGVERPAVGLLGIGEEATKGSALVRTAHKLLSDLGDELNFVGNVEGNVAFEGSTHVVVCDGFAGNVFLKTAEGAAGAIVVGLREALNSSIGAKIGALLVRGALRRFMGRFDYATVGGAPLLGVKGICIVCHGRSDARAIKGAISVAKRAVETRVIDHIADSCKADANVPEASEAPTPG